MAGSFLTEVDGWTPIIDVVAAKVGLIPAAVYGLVWRYCQMGSGTCYASQSTLAEKLGIGQATVQRHLRTLCDAGFLEDTTPGLRNKPHTYRDTGRVQIVGMVEARYSERIVESEPEPAAQSKLDCHDPERIVTIQSELSQSRKSYEDTTKRLVGDNEETLPDAGASGTRAAEEDLSPSRAMFTALAGVCQIDTRIATDGQRGELNQTERMLRKVGVTPGQLVEFPDWWSAHDWRGQKGQPPRPSQVRETWAQYRAFVTERERRRLPGGAVIMPSSRGQV